MNNENLTMSENENQPTKDKDMCMDWNDTIENDGNKPVILEEDDYNFEVTGFERSRFPGGAKVPACNKASLTLTVQTHEGTATIRTDLLLYRSLEWRLSSFFRCIGQKKPGEKLVMDWTKVVGSRGRAHFKPRTYIDKYGIERLKNDVDRFYDYDEKFFVNDDVSWMTPSDDEEHPFF